MNAAGKIYESLFRALAAQGVQTGSKLVLFRGAKPDRENSRDTKC